MAGDWIKMRVDLAEDPAVIGIAAQLDIDEFAVVGRLQALWSWADGQSRDGHAAGVTASWVNRKVQCDGFAEAMVFVGWLQITEGGITFPNFVVHNGESAKARALGKNRKQKQRSNGDGHVEEHKSDANMSRSERDENVTREEKRREENTEDTFQPPKGGGRDLSATDLEGFEEFWAAYPRKVGKDAARKAFSKRRAGQQLVAEMVAAIAEQAGSAQWTRDGGQYIPHPATWLNEGRWQDEASQHAAAGQPARKRELVL